MIIIIMNLIQKFATFRSLGAEESFGLVCRGTAAGGAIFLPLSSISELQKDKDVVKRVFPGNGAC